MLDQSSRVYHCHRTDQGQCRVPERRRPSPLHDADADVQASGAIQATAGELLRDSPGACVPRSACRSFPLSSVRLLREQASVLGDDGLNQQLAGVLGSFTFGAVLAIELIANLLGRLGVGGGPLVHDLVQRLDQQEKRWRQANRVPLLRGDDALGLLEGQELAYQGDLRKPRHHCVLADWRLRRIARSLLTPLPGARSVFPTREGSILQDAGKELAQILDVDGADSKRLVEGLRHVVGTRGQPAGVEHHKP
mmetsp:Transcript_8543/g.32161  ORF Transcript_8543/g.32161 Transcript_8543/m.32161 type:complete len:251 (+) Transcript_8543:818-1570(+)